MERKPHHLDANDPSNAGLIRYMPSKPRVSAVPITPPKSSGRHPYLEHGSHPEVVERVWDQLGPALPVDCRCLLYGTPALVAPVLGIVLAVAWGTAHVLRIPLAVMPAALKAGARTVMHWSTGREMNVAKEFGEDWVFGCWAKDEPQWCRSIYEAVEAGAH
jgi:hypothetical protein